MNRKTASGRAGILYYGPYKIIILSKSSFCIGGRVVRPGFKTAARLFPNIPLRLNILLIKKIGTNTRYTKSTVPVFLVFNLIDFFCLKNGNFEP
jgi:hypothetical protein